MKINTNKQPEAQKNFTDREEPRQAFWSEYDTYEQTIKQDQIRVLTYYGIGGIGKSSLLHELQKELNKINLHRHLYLDFNYAQSARTILLQLRHKFITQHGYSFPLFELALGEFAEKNGEKFQGSELSGLISEESVLGQAIEICSEFPGIDVLAKVLKVANKGTKFAKHLAAKLSNKYRKELEEISTMRSEELQRRLPYYFTCDLREHLQDLNEPFVIFLDTYEMLVPELVGKGDTFFQDEFLRHTKYGLVCNLPNVLWVIAGRDKLKWERFDSGWSEALD
jgi:hypothetical protein